MRVPAHVHRSRAWRIHEITGDFRLEDAWAVPGVAGPDGFDRIVRSFAAFDPVRASSLAVRTLFTIRRKLGELLGWDGPETGIGSRVATIRDRLPADLRDSPDPLPDGHPFASLYLTDDEWAAEIANQTVHGIVHVGRVADRAGGFRAELAVYVKPNGRLGEAYLAAIKPFRYLLVYPSLLRQLERAQQDAAVGAARGAES